MKTVFIMRGIPGAGKSTLAQMLLDLSSDSIICSADHFFMRDGKYEYRPELIGHAHAACYAEFVRALEDERNVVIVDNTHIQHDSWQPYLTFAKSKGYAVATVVAEEWDPGVTHPRNKHRVPLDKIKRMAEKFER